MSETPSAPFPVPKPPPPPLKGRVELNTNLGRPDSGPMSLPPSLALPTDDELRAERSRQELLTRQSQPTGPQDSGGIVSVSRVAVPPVTPAAPAAPAVPAAPVAPELPTPVPAQGSAAPANVGTASDVRPPTTPVAPATPVVPVAPVTPVAQAVPAAPVNPLGQRLVRRQSPPTLAEQISQPAASPTPTATLFPTTPTPTAVSPAPAAKLDANMDMLAGLNDDQPKKRRGPWLALGIVALLLVVAGGVSLWLQSSGTIYSSFLQKVVGGFPKAPDQALVLMRQKLPATYGVKGQISLVKSTQLPSIGGDSNTQTTAEASGSVDGSQQNGNWQASFNLQLANDYPVTTLQGEGIRLDTKRYLFLDTLSLLVANNDWQEIKDSDWSSTALSVPFSAVELPSILSRASEGQYLGQNSLTVSGQTYSVNVYQYKVDQASDYNDASYQEGRLLVWINRKTGQAVEYQLDERLKNDGLGDFVFQSVWEIDSAATLTAIALPDGEKASSGSITKIGQDLGFITSPTGGQDLTTVAGRDAKRLADLLALKEALQEYHTKSGTYPVASTPDKTNDSRVLKAALVPTYIDALPVDPQDPKAYYGYTSDGFSFKLTSIVEDTTSSGAKKGNGFYYQEVTN